MKISQIGMMIYTKVLELRGWEIELNQHISKGPGLMVSLDAKIAIENVREMGQMIEW